MVHEFDVGVLLYDLSFVISYSSSSSCAYFMSISIFDSNQGNNWYLHIFQMHLLS